MDDFDKELHTPPCSAAEAKAGFHTIVQLYLVDEALKKSPLPREDFYAQYPVTPERQTPEDQRTPPPRKYTHEESLQISKDWATGVAEGLRQFHAGRVMLRREEAEQHRDLEQDPDHWDSKAKQWQDFGWRLIKELGKRKRKELKGEAKEGYAQAMLLSPAQSPSPAPLDIGLQKVTQQSKPLVTLSDESPEINRRPSSQEPLQSTPQHNGGSHATLTKGHKRTRKEYEDQEQSLEHTKRNKRQRREMATTQQKQEPVPVTKSTQGTRIATPRVRKNEAHAEPKVDDPSPNPRPPQPKISWELRPRKKISYRETGSRTIVKHKGHQGKRKPRQTKPRGHTKRARS